MPRGTSEKRATRADVRRRFLQIFKILMRHFGPQGWWPGETPFEVCVGAILTQNTAWTNVERAISRLKAKKILSSEGLRRVRLSQLSTLIHSAGYFNVKARRLKAFSNFLWGEFEGDLEAMLQGPVGPLREALLSVNGIGPETADSILLYAGGFPVFVIDAYTRRSLERLGLTDSKADYDSLQALFERHLPRDSELYNEFHALWVALGKNYCKPKPLCDLCPLNRICPYPARRKG